MRKRFALLASLVMTMLLSLTTEPLRAQTVAAQQQGIFAPPPVPVGPAVNPQTTTLTPAAQPQVLPQRSPYSGESR